MKYAPLIWAGLWRKPLRTVFTMLSLMMAFVLFGLLQGITTGFGVLLESARMDGLYVSARYSTPMPMSYKEQLAQLPGVKSVTAISFISGIVNDDPKKPLGIGFAEDGFFNFYRWIDITPAQVAQLRANRTAIVVGKATADRFGLKAGQRMTLKAPVMMKTGAAEWTLDVLAVIDRNDIPNSASVVVGNYEYVNEDRSAGKDQVNQFMVLLNDPAIAVSTARTIDSMFMNSAAPTRTVVDKLNSEEHYGDDNSHAMVPIIVLAALFALVLMTSSTMMQSFRERIPEFGTLKALGFSDTHVLALILAEALAQCLIGAALGLAIAGVLVPYAKSLVTDLASTVMMVSWPLVGVGLLVACLIALVSAGLPAWRAKRMQTIDALAVR